MSDTGPKPHPSAPVPSEQGHAVWSLRGCLTPEDSQSPVDLDGEGKTVSSPPKEETSIPKSSSEPAAEPQCRQSPAR